MTGLKLVQIGLRTRPNFAYKFWRFQTVLLVSSTVTDNFKLERQCCHLVYVHQSDFIPKMQKAACKTRGRLTTTVLSVQGNSLLLHKTMECFRLSFCADSDTSWWKLLLFTIVMYGLVKVPYQSAHYFSMNIYMKTLLKPEAFINVTICLLTSSSG